MKRRQFLAIRPVLFAFAAWLLVAAPLAWLFDWLPPARYEFGLPLVCVPYTPGTDVVSLVPDLFSALALACLCVLMVEIAKAMISALPGRQTWSYTLLSIYQASLLIDVLRKYAWDWYGYLLYFTRLITLSYDRPRPEVLPIPPPWLSFLLFLACVGISVWDLFRRQQPGATPPELGQG